MKIKSKKILFALLPILAVAPAAIAVSCGEENTSEATVVKTDELGDKTFDTAETLKLDYESLLDLDIAGDTRYFTYKMPFGVEEFNNKAMQKYNLKNKPVEVYARLNLSSKKAGVADVNQAWMPISILQSYMANKLIWKNNEAYIQTPDGEKSIGDTFGQMFNFSKENIDFDAAAKMLGEIPLNSLELKYHLLEKVDFSFSDKSEASKVVRPLLGIKTWTYIDKIDNTNQNREKLTTSLRIDLKKTPTNAALEWNKRSDSGVEWPSGWSGKVEKLMYAIVSDEVLKKQSEIDKIKWSDELPTSAPFLVGRDWNVIAKIVPKNGFSFKNETINLTEYSNIRQLKLDLSTSEMYSAFDLTLVEVVARNKRYNPSFLVDESKFREKISSMFGSSYADTIKVWYATSFSNDQPYLNISNRTKWIDSGALAIGYDYEASPYQRLLLGALPGGLKLNDEMNNIWAKIEITGLNENIVFNSPIVKLSNIIFMK